MNKIEIQILSTLSNRSFSVGPLIAVEHTFCTGEVLRAPSKGICVHLREFAVQVNFEIDVIVRCDVSPRVQRRNDPECE
jgi:hypothetical protein